MGNWLCGVSSGRDRGQRATTRVGCKAYICGNAAVNNGQSKECVAMHNHDQSQEDLWRVVAINISSNVLREKKGRRTLTVGGRTLMGHQTSD